MSFHGKWPDEHVARLRELWKMSGKDVDQFKASVAKDPLLSKRSQGAIMVQARRLGLIISGKDFTKRFWWAHLNKEQQDLFRTLAKDPAVSYDDMAERFKHTNIEIQQMARRLGIPTNKNKIGIRLREERRIQAAQLGGPDSEGMFNAEEKVLIGRILKLIKKDHRIRVAAAAQELDIEKTVFRGFLKKLVESGILLDLVDVTDDTTYYYANKAKFYKPKQLVALIGTVEVDRITNHVDDHPRSAESLTTLIYGKHPNPPVHIVATVLERLVQHGLVKTRHHKYSRSERGREFGLDSRSIAYMDNAVVEAAAFVKEERTSDTPKTLRAVGKELNDDRAAKHIVTVPAPPDVQKSDSVSLLFMAEILYGNQSTDQQLIDFVLERAQPDLAFVSGLVQGTYTGITLVDKRRVLVKHGLLKKIGGQLATAGLFLNELERKTKHGLYVVQGDDDWHNAKQYAELAQLAEGKRWQFSGVPASLGAELRRRLNVEDFYQKFEIQWELICAYQYRVGRSLYNKSEVHRLIGVRKSEYRLILEIMAFSKLGVGWPADYEKVVNVAALSGNIGKRIVTPDTLHLGLWGDEILFTHNSNFSYITQYVDPIFALESALRQWQARGGKTPKLVVDAQQEMFYGHYLRGTWLMTLPGMQNTEEGSTFRRKEFNRFVLSSKEHRQNTFRKTPANSAVVDLQMFKDGRMRLRLTNDKVMEVLKRERSKPHERHGVCVVTDTQHGSITMQPEAEVLFMDYSLYDRKDDRLYFNGDILHGNNYPQHFAESRPLRLLSINSQLNFTSAIHMPLIENAPELTEVGWWLGNHEWNTFGRNFTGTNDLEPLAKEVQGRIRAIQALEKQFGRRISKLNRAMSVARIRFMKSHNLPSLVSGKRGEGAEGDVVNWPYFATELAGFKVAISHMWQPWGGRTPIMQFQRWIRGMAGACGDIDVMVGGHLHTVWFAQEANKLLLQLGASAGLSGYELARGLFSTVMFTRLEFDNREGIIVEYIPPEFLFFDYEPQSPFLVGRKSELIRPQPGTRDWKLGKISPFMERVIDECTWYLPE